MRYKVEICPLTPVHIGTGQEIGLFEYKVLNNDGGAGHRFMRFSPDKVISRMNDMQKASLLQHTESNDLKSIARDISSVANADDVLYQLPASESFAHEYESKKDNFDTQLAVQEMYRQPNIFTPIIPGSSLKGAIRTAIINLKSKEIGFDRPSPREFEKNVLGYTDARNDPFRAVHFSDCTITGDHREFVGQVFNYKDDFRSIQIFQEQLSGTLSGGNANGHCELTFDECLQGIKKSVRHGKKEWEPLSTIIDIKMIIDACNSFYKKNLLDEYEKFYKPSNFTDLKAIADNLNDLVTGIKPENLDCLIRIGRHSHIENVTDAHYRKPQVIKYGTTRFISEKLYPMGWIKVTLVNP